MLIFNFSRIFKQRGIDRPFSYMISKGYSDNFATRIANSRMQQFKLNQIEELCNLFQCTPNDLLQWIPDANDRDNEKHHLMPLKRTDKVLHLTRILNEVPLDKLTEIENMIIREIDKKTDS